MKLFINEKEIEIIRFSAESTDLDIEFTSELSNIEILELFKNFDSIKISVDTEIFNESTGKNETITEIKDFSDKKNVLSFSGTMNIEDLTTKYFVILSSKGV